jgi:predicted PurR-regulated permease PerM
MEKVNRIIKIVLWAAIAIVFLAILLFRLRSLASVLLISAMLAYLLHKPLKALEKKLTRPWALLIIFGLLTGFFTLLCSYIIPLFVRQAADLLGYVPKVMQGLESFLQKTGEKTGEPLSGILTQFFGNFYTRTADWMGAATLSVAQAGYSNLGWALLTPFLTFYFLKDHEYFMDQINYLVPLKYRKDVKTLLSSIDLALGHFLRGQFIVSVAVAAMTTIGFAIIGVPNYLLLGLLCGLCNMIPYVGPFIGAVPVALASAVQGWKILLLALAVVLAVQEIDNMVISPKVMGNHLKIHPVYIIIAIIAGSGLVGIIGIIFALPALIILRETTQFLFHRRLYQKSDIEKI